jgi:hypothetical protein
MQMLTTDLQAQWEALAPTTQAQIQTLLDAFDAELLTEDAMLAAFARVLLRMPLDYQGDAWQYMRMWLISRHRR